MTNRQSTGDHLALLIAKAEMAGLKLTPQRLAIYKLVTASNDHPSVYDIHRQLIKQMPTLSLDTVYRTLRTLSELGLIHTINPHRENLRFDSNLSRHHHFVCTKCGSISDFTDVYLDSIALPPETVKLGEAQTLHVEISGTCKACLNTEQTDTN